MISPHEKINPMAGDYLEPDGWSCGAALIESDGFSDSLFAGCQFRLPMNDGTRIRLAINIKTTGKPRWTGLSWKSRCRIELVQDNNEISTFHGGAFYTNEKRRPAINT